MISETEIFNAVGHILANTFAIFVIVYFAFAARYQPEKFKGLVIIFHNAMLTVRFCFLLVASSIYATRTRSLVYTFEDLDGNVSSAD
ncbi:hypothetical protein DL95DRAFT_461463 [Leptodontidium sp. 2 PMI_412]|nr:hypothetical protein BKA61DRAFT_681153 [Leptodontidium sp. MPI-SDFR-AT-0119]KAH9215207.1 hypothetical protein DL95DRAFT_461463 [Leptodontidium sp. 2 PMI_412]